MVDDNVDAADSIAVVLRVQGHEVCTAYDGLEGLDVAGKFQPDVALVDLGLPKLNGYDLARRIRECPWGKSMVLIALTGWGQEEDLRRSRDAGFDHHLVKPVKSEALRDLLTQPQAGAKPTQ